MSGILVIIGAAWFIGGVGVTVLGLRPLESLVVRLYLGLSVTAILVLIAGSYSLNILTYVLALSIVLSAGFTRALKSHQSEALESEDAPEPLEWFDWACLGASGVVCGLMFLAALAPVTSWDAGVAHLALPSDYVRDGRIHLLIGNVYSAYPQALHCLFTYIFYMSGERGVMLFCWLLSLLACATLYLLGNRLGGRRAGILAVMFLTTAPIFISQAGTVAIDIPFVGVVLATLLCLVIWQRERDTKWLVVAALLAGYACGIRHTGYIATGLCAIGILIESRHPKPFLVFAALAAIAAAPWYLRSFLLVGNPVYPLLEGIFDQDVFARHQVTEFGAHESIKTTSVFGFLTYSWDLIMHPNRYDGWSASPGGWVWILGIPGIIMGGRAAQWIGLFCLAGISSFYMVQRLARYAVGFFVPMLAVAGISGSRLTRKSRWMSVGIVCATAYGCVLAFGSMYFKIPTALGMESRTEYLERRLDRFEVFEWINANVPDDGAILTLDLRSYYIDRVTNQNTSELYVLKEMDFEEKAAWFSERGIRYLVIPYDEVEFTPIIQAMGLREEFESWETAPEQFRALAVLGVERTRGDGVERVVIYEVISPEFGNQ